MYVGLIWSAKGRIHDEGGDGLCACVQCPLLITQYMELSVRVSTADVSSCRCGLCICVQSVNAYILA